MIVSASVRVYGSTTFFTGLGLSSEAVGFLVIKPSNTAVLNTLDSLMIAFRFTPTEVHWICEITPRSIVGVIISSRRSPRYGIQYMLKMLL
ncbi:hypothetical protein D3C79_629340 [compost metagenome]